MEALPKHTEEKTIGGRESNTRKIAKKNEKTSGNKRFARLRGK